MNVIENNIMNVYEIKKSKFITYIYKITKLEEVNSILDELRNKYKDATHICYGYKLENIIRFSDDNEPGGTAGLPIIEVLNKKNIDYCLAVVIRYFGGIKLGAGGLVRAYSKSVSDALSNTKIIELRNGKEIIIEVTYDENKKLSYLLKDKKVINIDYKENVIYTVHLEDNDIDLINEYNYKIIKDIKL